MNPTTATARRVGVLYLLFALVGIFREFLFPAFVVAGDATATARNITAADLTYRIGLLTGFGTERQASGALAPRHEHRRVGALLRRRPRFRDDQDVDARGQVALVLAAARTGGHHAPGVRGGRTPRRQACGRTWPGCIDMLSVRRRPGHIPRRPVARHRGLEALRRERHVGHVPVGSGWLQDRVREPDGRPGGDGVRRAIGPVPFAPRRLSPRTADALCGLNSAWVWRRLPPDERRAAAAARARIR
jgi:hypothetical protein